MIRRINSITDIGCFRSVQLARLQFSPLTFIYGENSNGKSTLCDVFRSLAENNPDHIQNRRSIPPLNNTPNPSVQLNLQHTDTEGEHNYQFRDGNWNRQLNDLNLHVFDTDFIHRNVFTGLAIERRNQQSVTEFILGEQNVESANRIAELNSSLRTIKKEITRISQEYFTGIPNIQDFVALNVEDDIETIESSITELRNQISNEETILTNIEQIVNRANPFIISELLNFQQLIQNINNDLEQCFVRIHENATEAVSDHIEHNCESSNSTESWLNQGLQVLKTDSCPFCGQSLNDSARELIDLYRSYFDRAFAEFTRNVTSSIEQHLNSINRFRNLQVLEVLHRNTTILNEYSELNEHEAFRNLIRALEDTKSNLINHCENWNNRFDELTQIINEKINQKRQSLYSEIPILEIDEFIQLFSTIESSCTNYNNQINEILDQIVEYKTTLNRETIQQRINSLNNEVNQARVLERRVRLDDQCRQFTHYQSLEESSNESIRNLRRELQNQQTEFLNEYFEEINRIFTLLGSRQFRIGQTINYRGNMPVVQVTATYCGQSVTGEQLSKVFSESDRRALAFSIFWARISRLSDDDAGRSIVVLDDPITSFDDGRIDRTIRLVEATRTRLRQIIILCHYTNLVKSYFIRSNGSNTGTILYSLTRDDTSSRIIAANPSDFTEPIQQRQLRRINDFIERRNQDDIFMDLRVFLETEIRNRFWLHVNRNELGQLQFSDLLSELKNLEIIDDQTFTLLDGLRQTLNIDHHVWLERAFEEKIGIAQDITDAIYAL